MTGLLESLVIWLAIALAPAIPLPFVGGRPVTRARGLWILGVLGVGIVWLAFRELWLALIGAWFLWHWGRAADPPALLPSVLSWVAVGASWGLLLSLPRAWLAWAPWAWLAIAGWQAGLLSARKFRLGGRQKGQLGSPVITALYLALVSPFCPWWGWPLLGAGLVVVWSWLAWVGVGVGLIWLSPGSWPFGVLAAAIVAILWAWSPVVAGQRIFEWTPRGDTFDSVVSRWRGWQLIDHHGRAHWLLGHGPATMEPALLAWGSRYDLELCWGEGFNDLLQLWYEYGLLGLAAAAAFCWPIVGRLTLGDPWSAAWVVGGVLSLGHWPLRHVSLALPWLAMSAYLVRG